MQAECKLNLHLAHESKEKKFYFQWISKQFLYDFIKVMQVQSNNSSFSWKAQFLEFLPIYTINILQKDNVVL